MRVLTLLFSGTDNSWISSVDGVRFNMYKNRHLQAAYAGGVTVVETWPQGKYVCDMLCCISACSVEICTYALRDWEPFFASCVYLSARCMLVV